MPQRCRGSAIFVSALLLAGWITDVLADPPPAPAVDRVWGGCVLTAGAVDELQASLASGLGGGGSQVDVVIVYSLQKDNDGQAKAPGFTGPILCTNSGDSGTVTIETTSENTPIPPLADQAAGVTVDIKAIEEALLLQYQKMQSGNPLGGREKRVCHTVAGHTDCFLIKPVD